MTEDTPFNPCSRKGEVRAQIAGMLLDEMRAGHLPAMITRSADFYGPGAINSFPHVTVFQRLAAGKSPQWLGAADKIHTFTYTPDAGRALALLGNTAEAFGQTWHLPTTGEPFTGKDFAALACELSGQPNRLQTMPRWMMKLLELFVPVLRENEEMMYQFDYDYRFDSSKIESVYGLQATPYRQGVEACLK
jgi:nucleoside-diphosphate-sugar epimerase